jgi:cytidine deaminase
MIRVELLDPIELSLEERELIRRATLARPSAQTHLSHYQVGAAIMSESGAIYGGCNAERSTYTQTTHAEQHAADSLIFAERQGAKIVAMAIVGALERADVWNVERFAMRPPKPEVEVKDFCFACGHCLQIIWENCLADPNVKLLLLTKWGEVARTTIGDAYPMPFGPESLGVDIRKR